MLSPIATGSFLRDDIEVRAPESEPDMDPKDHKPSWRRRSLPAKRAFTVDELAAMRCMTSAPKRLLDASRPAEG